MSHFDTTRTTIKDRDILIQSIRACPEVKEIKYQSYVRGYNKKAALADIVAVLQGEYDLGFKAIAADNTYSAVADFSFGTCGGGDKKLVEVLNKIVGEYQRRKVEHEVATNKSLTGSTINVTVR